MCFLKARRGCCCFLLSALLQGTTDQAGFRGIRISKRHPDWTIRGHGGGHSAEYSTVLDDFVSMFMQPASRGVRRGHPKSQSQVERETLVLNAQMLLYWDLVIPAGCQSSHDLLPGVSQLTFLHCLLTQSKTTNQVNPIRPFSPLPPHLSPQPSLPVLQYDPSYGPSRPAKDSSHPPTVYMHADHPFGFDRTRHPFFFGCIKARPASWLSTSAKSVLKQ
ncbi:hypothetical protein BKA65DRAFT_563215 [Rhexocercosporidium sp. MPI-PUGE-AT-0058]|nr:hypothetical protein BKA65DRAFT_563215 [Rhexocercosporidium sp. MPI-PUGE-AT-0058]